MCVCFFMITVSNISHIHTHNRGPTIIRFHPMDLYLTLAGYKSRTVALSLKSVASGGTLAGKKNERKEPHLVVSPT